MAHWTGDYVFRDDDCRDKYHDLQLATVERMRLDGLLSVPDNDALRRYLMWLIDQGSASLRYDQQSKSAWVFWRGRWMPFDAFKQLASQDGASDSQRGKGWGSGGAWGSGWKFGG